MVLVFLKKALDFIKKGYVMVLWNTNTDRNKDESTSVVSIIKTLFNK